MIGLAELNDRTLKAKRGREKLLVEEKWGAEELLSAAIDKMPTCTWFICYFIPPGELKYLPGTLVPFKMKQYNLQVLGAPSMDKDTVIVKDEEDDDFLVENGFDRPLAIVEWNERFNACEEAGLESMQEFKKLKLLLKDKNNLIPEKEFSKDNEYPKEIRSPLRNS